MAQISSAFKNFGVSSGDRCCVIAKLVDGDSDFDMNSVCASVCGRQLPVSSISEFTSDETIKKVRVSMVDSSYFCHAPLGVCSAKRRHQSPE